MSNTTRSLPCGPMAAGPQGRMAAGPHGRKAAGPGLVAGN